MLPEIVFELNKTCILFVNTGWRVQLDADVDPGTHLPFSEEWTAELTVSLGKMVPERIEPSTS